MWEFLRGTAATSGSGGNPTSPSSTWSAGAGGGGGGGGGGGSGGSSTSTDRFTLANLGSHLDALDALPAQPTAAQSAAAVERLRALAEALCWGDQHELSDFFELFLERSGTRAFLRLLQTAGSTEAAGVGAGGGSEPNLPAQVRVYML